MPLRTVIVLDKFKGRVACRAVARRRRVLIVPEKFKGTLTAQAAAAAMAAGWRKARPGDRVETLPMSDGGDGFGAVLGELMGAREEFTQTVNAAHQPTLASWWHVKTSKTAIIDSAEIIGLAMLPAGKFHPFQLDSYGLGKVMQAAVRAGTTRGIVGIGGSATNDGGFGMARALGWKFFNQSWDELTEWWQLRELTRIRPPAQSLDWKLTVAVDVGNPLLGRNGCSRIYGPQKGLRSQDLALAERCLARLSEVLKAQHKIGDAKMPGAGAAGGLGYGLMTFAGARMESGFEIFARIARLDHRIRKADLVLTGEGRIDGQTYMGKGVGQIARRCRKWGVPCLALAGIILEPARARQLFARARALTEITDLARAQSEAARHLRQLAVEMARVFVK
jgi:glycerate 2-kinase